MISFSVITRCILSTSSSIKIMKVRFPPVERFLQHNCIDIDSLKTMRIPLRGLYMTRVPVHTLCCVLSHSYSLGNYRSITYNRLILSSDHIVLSCFFTVIGNSKVTPCSTHSSTETNISQDQCPCCFDSPCHPKAS